MSRKLRNSQRKTRVVRQSSKKKHSRARDTTAPRQHRSPDRSSPHSATGTKQINSYFLFQSHVINAIMFKLPRHYHIYAFSAEFRLIPGFEFHPKTTAASISVQNNVNVSEPALFLFVCLLILYFNCKKKHVLHSLLSVLVLVTRKCSL